jgi:hypothetical protein
MTKTKSAAGLGLMALVGAGLVVTASPAAAKGGGGSIATGKCSSGAVWKLKGKHDSGRIEMEFEVDSNVAGQTWAVRVTDNGVVVFSGNKVTQRPSGSFSVEKRIANRAGVDKLVATAKRGSATCTGRLSV